jgi:hypothetical protein
VQVVDMEWTKVKYEYAEVCKETSEAAKVKSF